MEENEPEEQAHDLSGSPQHSDSDSTILEEHKASDTDGRKPVHSDSESDFETVIGHLSSEDIFLLMEKILERTIFHLR